MSEAAAESKTVEEQLAELQAERAELARRLEVLEKTEPGTAAGAKAEAAVEAQETKVETAAERVGLTEEAIDAIAAKVEASLTRWADEADEAEAAARETEKEQGELGRLAAGTEPAPPPETAATAGAESSTGAGSETPPPPEPEQPPEKVHWSQRRVGGGGE